MELNKYDWTKFGVSFYYPTSLENVFEYWSTAQGLKKFFIENAEVKSSGEIIDENSQIKAGDKYSWTWRHGYSIAGEFKEVIPNKLITFTFGNMLVNLVFKSRGSKTLVHLQQSEIAESELGMVMGHLNCRSCWVFFMTNLKSVILNGADLRDDEPSLASAYEVSFMPNELK